MAESSIRYDERCPPAWLSAWSRVEATGVLPQRRSLFRPIRVIADLNQCGDQLPGAKVPGLVSLLHAAICLAQALGLLVASEFGKARAVRAHQHGNQHRVSLRVLHFAVQFR